MYEFAGYSEIVSNSRWYIIPLKYGLILTGFLMLFNIINAIYIFKINKPSKEILFIAMMVKISFILLYVVYFIIEVIIFYTIIGIPITVTFLYLDILFLVHLLFIESVDS
ncbi:putative membrane protein [Clostridium bornimense]|uniref:Putative membrane protein n=1 Tax=Clostridium bornimense TaxID=1216932 RepID=W6SKH2_9CLOT|nr:putative membrane protein [Clostridium bornimense]